MGVEIKLPGARVGLIRWTNGRSAMDDQIPRVGVVDGDIEETNRRGIAELLVGISSNI